MTRFLSASLTALVLAGCGGQQMRFDLPPQPPAQRIPVSTSTLEVRDVSLPLYANQEVIYYQGEDGALVFDDNILWADDPQRAFTEGLADALSARTRARIAAEPWPYYEQPTQRLEVRFNRALPGRDGQYRLSGQYYVASGDGEGRDISGTFSLSESYDPEQLGTIPLAKARLIARLADQIAREAL